MKKLLILLSFCGAFTAIQAMELTCTWKRKLKYVLQPLTLEEFGESPLHFAAYNGDIETIKNLLVKAKKQGKNIVNTLTKIDATPLHNAAMEGHLLAVKLLVEAGADTTLKEAGGYTALGLAKWFMKANKGLYDIRGNKAVVDYLNEIETVD